MLHVAPIPCLADNYAWALFLHPGADPPAQIGGAAVVVDPGEAAPVAAFLAARNLRLDAIWLTHHHADHTAGAEDLAHNTGARIVGAALDSHRLPPLDQAVADLDSWPALGHEVVALAVPGHTRGAVAFWVPAAQALFTGDTLFAGGCGRLMEGTAAEMMASLARLAGLPASTRIFCGHEYTVRNLTFARGILPRDRALAARLTAAEHLRRQSRPTLPATLGEEQATNLFLRAGAPEVLAAAGATRPEDAFAWLRARRDVF